MASVTQKIAIDVSKENIFRTIVAKQNDSNSRFLEVTITNCGEVVPIEQSAVVTINAKREDGESSAFAGSVNSDGSVTLPLSNWMLALEGMLVCDISAFGSNGAKLTTTSFRIEVEGSTYDGNDIGDDDDFGVLVTLLSECADIKAEELERVAAETDRQNAESMRVAAETSRANAEATRQANTASAIQSAMNAADVVHAALPQAIVSDAHGAEIILEDAANAPIQSLRVIGGCTQSAVPSIEHPVEIQSVGTYIESGEHQGKYAVTIRGRAKNRFDKSLSGDSSIRNETESSYWGSNIFYGSFDVGKILPPLTTVTVSFDVICTEIPNATHAIASDGKYVGLLIRKNGSQVADMRKSTKLYVGQTLHYSSTFTVPDGSGNCVGYLYSNRYTKNGANAHPKIILKNIQIEFGDSETAYEPYAPDCEATIYLDRPLFGAGDNTNEIIVSEDGSGKIVERFSQKIFSGSETWSGTMIGSRQFFYSSLPNSPAADANFPYVCNYFEYGNYQSCKNGLTDSCFGSGVFQMYTGHATAAAVKTWVTSMANNGTPLTVVYKRAMPLETPLSAEQVQEILALRTYKPLTVITTNGTEIDITYVCDPKNYIGRGGGGKSAYQIAVDNGFVGTETEWLDSLGGAAGESYTPVKGVDYFTDSDKEELIQMLLAQFELGQNEIAESLAAITLGGNI